MRISTALLTALLVTSCDLAPPEVLVAFDGAASETPESVGAGNSGSVYVSLALTGEVVKVAPGGVRSTYAILPLGDPSACQGPFPGLLGALAIGWDDSVYVNVNSCDLDLKGPWRISPDGTTTQLGTAPPDALVNGIVDHVGVIYSSDSLNPRVLATPMSGGDTVVWLESDLLADPNPTDTTPGANGVQIFLHEMLIANSGARTFVAVPLEYSTDGVVPGVPFVKYGPPGTGASIEIDDAFPGGDDFAFDVLGRMYVTTDPFQTVLRIDTDGSVHTLLTADDGIDGPTSVAFGRGVHRHDVYLTNAMFPFFPPTGNGPSLMHMVSDVSGYPR